MVERWLAHHMNRAARIVQAATAGITRIHVRIVRDHTYSTQGAYVS
jgi:hypothetical protein